MSVTLQQRAQAFLKRPIPPEMTYIADSMSERFITAYAKNGGLDLDPELAEMLEICVAESEHAAEQKSGDEQLFFQECAAILREILKASA